MVFNSAKTNHMKIILILLCVLLSTACKSANQESVIFHDHVFETSVKKELDIAKVPYKEAEDGSIWYPVEYRDNVKAAISKVSAGLPLAFNFFDRERKEAFVSQLKKENIGYTTGEIDGGYKVIVDEKYHDRAANIFHGIMGTR